MQNSSMYTYINPHPPQFPEQVQLKCPRCDSTNTKFCYYNNYNLSQPRHFCKSCRRYWTKGGVLRNIPVGGGTRKNTKRSSSSAVAYSPTAHHPKRPAPAASSVSPPASGTNTETFLLKANNYLEQFGSTSSLLGTSGGKFGNFLDGRNLQRDGLGFEPGTRQDPVQNVDPQVRLEGGSDNIAEEFLNVQGGNGLADLGMYTNPGSTFR